MSNWLESCIFLSPKDIMPLLTIRHLTTYRYRRPVGFGEHRIMFRPRDSHDQRVIEANLDVRPEPNSLRFIQDAFCNHVAIASFSRRSNSLCFESIVRVEHSPADVASLGIDAAGTFPADYGGDEMPDLAHCIERGQLDPGNEVGRWARQFLPASGSIGTFELLGRLSEGINHGFRYRRREAKGIQHPVETLRLGHGSCRDFALLMIEGVRSLGFAARFASGYLAIPNGDLGHRACDAARGATHAWAQIYVPAAGWIGFDPTRGSAGNTGLVTVAVVRDPRHAIPLHGTFIGASSDYLGMDVQVSVTSDAPKVIWAPSEPAERLQFSQLV